MGDLFPVVEAIYSVTRIQTESGSEGTGFVVRYGSNYVLVTAAHGVPNETRVEFLLSRFDLIGTDRVSAERVDDPDMSSEDDIALFRLQNWPLSPILTTDRLCAEGIRFGEEVLLLGFPTGLAFASEMGGSAVTTPMVKRGVLATMDFPTANGSPRFYIDLVANPGFSGSPVLFRHAVSGEIRVAGMVLQTATMKVPAGDELIGASAYADLSLAVSVSRIREHIEQSFA